MKIKKNGKVFRLTESDLKKIVKRVLTEDSGEEITKQQMMDATRMDDNMKLIGPAGNEIPVERTIIDGIDVLMFGYADKGNNNDEYKLTLGAPINQTYKGRYIEDEAWMDVSPGVVIIDVPNSKYMIKINLVGPKD